MNRFSVINQKSLLVTESTVDNSRKDIEDMDIFQHEEALKETEDMDIEELDLDGIKRDCQDKDSGYVPQEQASLLKEAILKSKTSNSLGIRSGSLVNKPKEQKNSVIGNYAVNPINRGWKMLG